jgi:uncharacterized protein
MRLNISDIPDEGLQQEFELPVVIHEGSKPDAVQVMLSVFRYGKKVLVEGSLKASVSLTCSRCLKSFICPVDGNFRDECNPSEELQKAGEQELAEQDLDISYYSNDEIDISELIKEQVLLAVPMKAVCSEECRGICSYCGRDLNDGACGCKVEEIDPRLAPLRKFREAAKDSGTS